jgi:hypothetical protein
MIDWWNALPLFSQILYAIAVPSTIILIVQLIITFTADIDEDMPDAIDVGEGEIAEPEIVEIDDINDIDLTDSDLNTAESDLTVAGIFTFRGIIAFLCSFSWVTLAVRAVGAPVIFAGIIGFIVGVAMMFAVAKLIHTLLGLAENGTVDFADAVGKTGSVYIPIPAHGTGKIIITFQGAERECEAVSDTAVTTGTEVLVLSAAGDVLTVSPITD